METEIWKDIPGYEGLYQVSNLGNVKSLKNGKWGVGNGKLLKYGKVFGYNSVGLYRDNKSVSFRLHRLIAQVFIDNPENKPCVNHINGIRDDNRIENLEWCTYSENNLHKYRILGNKSHGGHKLKFGKDNHSSKKVNQYDLYGSFIKTWDSMMDIQRELGIRNSNISECCSGKYKTAGGFIWKYFNN